MTVRPWRRALKLLSYTVLLLQHMFMSLLCLLMHVCLKTMLALCCAVQLEHPPSVDASIDNDRALCKKRYALSPLGAITYNFKRHWLLYTRNKGLIYFRMVQVVIIGLIIGSLFFNLQPSLNSVRLFFGASFLTILFLAFGSSPELSLVMNNRR